MPLGGARKIAPRKEARQGCLARMREAESGERHACGLARV